MKGTWPENLLNDNIARFHGALGPQVAEELAPLRQQVSSTKHPWNKISIASLFGGGGLAFFTEQQWAGTAMPIIIAAIGGFIGTQSVARKKNKLARTAKARLSHYVQDKIGLRIFDVSGTHGGVLQTFGAAGFLGSYDRVHYLAGLGPQSGTQSGVQTPDAIQSIGTKLTRTETETYTDSNGRTRTRQRIVTVFEGLMLEIDVPEFKSGNRTLITSRRTHRMRGAFDRRAGGAGPKMDKIKTSSGTFNKYYKVRTDDSTLAHLFLDPDRVMRLNNLYADLSQIIGRKRVPISILITQGKAWIALETNGLPDMESFSGDSEKFGAEIGAVIGQAALPHIIAQHLKLPAPIPYAWQDHVLDTKDVRP